MDDRTGGAVSRVGDNFDPAFDLELRCDFVYIRRDGVGGGERTAAGLKIVAFDDPADFLDRFAVQSAGATDALESVVFGRIVAARDHNRAMRVQVLRRMVEHGRGNGADIGDVAAYGTQAFDQRLAQPRRAETAVAAHVDVRAADIGISAAALTPQIGTQAAAELFNVG